MKNNRSNWNISTTFVSTQSYKTINFLEMKPCNLLLWNKYVLSFHPLVSHANFMVNRVHYGLWSKSESKLLWFIFCYSKVSGHPNSSSDTLLMKSSNCFGVELTSRRWCKGYMIDGGFVVVCFRPIGSVWLINHQAGSWKQLAN